MTVPSTPPPPAPRVSGTLRGASATLLRLLVVVVALYVALRVIGMVRDVLVALFIALVFAALGRPLSQRLSQVMPKWLAVLATFIVAILIAGGAITFVVTSVANSWGTLSSDVQDGVRRLQTWLQTGPLHLTHAQLSQVAAKATAWLSTHGGSIAAGLLGNVSSVLGVLTAVATALFASIFFITSGPTIWDWLVGWLPVRAQVRTDQAGRIAWTTFAGYTRGIVLVAVADAILVGAGLFILQVPLAPALMVVVFIGAFIPVIGAPVATWFAALVTLATKGPWEALIVLGLSVVAGEIDGHVFQPFIMGREVSLHPLAIVLVVAIGTTTAGFLGALVAVPIAAVSYAVIKYLAGRDVAHPLVADPAGDQAGPPAGSPLRAPGVSDTATGPMALRSGGPPASPVGGQVVGGVVGAAAERRADGPPVADHA